jgi:hypothetical protein
MIVNLKRQQNKFTILYLMVRVVWAVLAVLVLLEKEFDL